MTQKNLNPGQPRQWLTEIFEQEYDGLIIFIESITNEEQHSEDILSQSFKNLIEAVDKAPAKFPARHNVKGLLVEIIKNNCVTWYRKRRPGNQEELLRLITDDNLVLNFEKRDIHQYVQSLIDKLSEQLKRVAHLTWVEGCGLEETAKRLKLKKEVVSVYRNRALKELRALVLAQKDNLPPGELFLILYWLYALA